MAELPKVDNSWEAEERRAAAAEQQARQIPFTTRNNPLVYMSPEQSAAREIERRNMRSLRADAEMRQNPASGAIYSGIMNMRYGG